MILHSEPCNFGTDCLEVMSRDGKSKVLVDSIDGAPIGKVNFVLRDSRDRVWITVSTRRPELDARLRTDLRRLHLPATRTALSPSSPMASGLRTEIRFDASEEFLYVVETTGGCISRLDRRPRQCGRAGNLRGPTKLVPAPGPTASRSTAMETLGTPCVADKLFGSDAAGRDMRVLLDEAIRRRSPRSSVAFLGNCVTEDVFSVARPRLAPWMASVTFGGRIFRTVYIGSLKGTHIPHFRAPVAGLPMVHWTEAEMWADRSRARYWMAERAQVATTSREQTAPGDPSSSEPDHAPRRPCRSAIDTVRPGARRQ